MMARTDQDLVDLARQGDQEAFGDLFQRHRQKCVDIACYYLRNREEAEDQVQTAFMKAYRYLDQYQGEAEFTTWLSRILTNQCLMAMRVQRRAKFLYLDETWTERATLPVELPATGPDPEGELAFLQLVTVLKTEIRRIPRFLQNVVLLRDLHGLPMADVAGQLGITVAAAKSRLVRARAELKSRMSRYCERISCSSVLSRSAAPLSRVARHCSMQVSLCR
jgi:RNA polymerase sigma-70 factor, ECF subfamily